MMHGKRDGSCGDVVRDGEVSRAIPKLTLVIPSERYVMGSDSCLHARAAQPLNYAVAVGREGAGQQHDVTLVIM